MDEGELRKLVHSKVMASLEERGIGGDTKSPLTKVPHHNYSVKPSKEAMVAANWKMNMTLEESRDFAIGGGAEAIAEHDVGSWSACRRHRRGWH